MISTYELGRQPVHVASPAAALTREGHEVIKVDTAVDELTSDTVISADAVAISVPMHTATRLATLVTKEIKATRPDLPVALYGLYAGVPEPGTGGDAPDALIQGEYEPGLIDWLASLERGGSNGAPERITHIGRSDFGVPDRSGLPSLGEYARLEHEGQSFVAGAVEASHGCRHRCRHCPIPAVYDGRMRVVPKDVVLADIDQLAAAGARHITFGDADFLNAPRHSIDVLEAAHQAHPDLTFDATIKVSHILDQRDIWSRLAELNLLFVVSAFESVDDRTLEILDKGHTAEDMAEAVGLVRSAGIHIRPTWLPFLPWTRPSDIVDMFEFIEAHDLVPATDPVQMSIKLLIPRGSLLEEHPAVTPHLIGYDADALTWKWQFADPETDTLHEELEAIAASASDCGQHFSETLVEMRSAVERLTGADLGPVSTSTAPVPRLTESWFCCAEPTESQVVTVGIGRR